jgi:putative molybdopterin biosynthesis protein
MVTRRASTTTVDDARGLAAAAPEPPRFMSVREVARYLQVNEKKVYALVNEGRIPATRLTGKWLFPRDLLDQWLLESSHGGLLTDRMVIAGSDDPLLARAVNLMAADLQGRAIVSHAATGTQLGLKLLAGRRADLCALHWGPDTESAQRHPALLRPYPQHRDWILVRLFRREQGLIVSPGVWSAERRLEELLTPAVRWAARQGGAGSNRFLQELFAEHRADPADRRVTARAYSERDAAAAVAMGQADVAPGARAAATEFGLEFRPIGWEAFDLALSRGIFFRTLFRTLLEQLGGDECRRMAQLLGGYDLADLGKLVWSP